MPQIQINQKKPNFFIRLTIGIIAVIFFPLSLIIIGLLYLFFPKQFSSIINYFLPLFSQKKYEYNSYEPKASSRNLIKHLIPSENSDFHRSLINCAQKLGYPAKDDGICYGFTMRWIEAVLTNTTSQFLERTNKILKLSAFLNDGETLEDLIEMNTFTSDELLDIKAFYESLLLYQYSYISSEILKKNISKKNLETISKIASSDKMINEGGLRETIPIYYGNLEQEKTRSFLEQMQKKVKESDCQEKISFLLTLITPQGQLHAVCIVFKPENDTWQYMDVNSFPPKNEVDLNTFIKQLPIKNYQAFSIRAIFPNKDIKNLESKIFEIPPLDESFENIEYLLLLAAGQGHLEIVQELLEKGAAPNQAMTDGATPLFIAAQNGHLEIVQELLEKGAAPNQAMTDSATPLFIAAQNGHLEIVQELLEKGAAPNQAMTDGATPLFIAAQNGHLEIVQELLEKGAAPDQAMTDGTTPLFIAAENGFLEVVQELLEKGAAPNQAMTDGATPLFIAAQNGHLEIVQELLEKGAAPNQAWTNGTTPLFIASRKGHLEVVQALLKKGSDPNQSKNDGGLCP